ncbi:hypothetical protein, variant [Allomyces macrogynus ATCC 38327]|nr:hypothetical protein, variant [Allomyces macrogynus ATCC 38327]|eukprot:KNE58596.1 hypothetical protein, variant [Allomyces macrogynus ATCC 38327]
MAPPAGSGSTARRTQFVDLDDDDDDDFKDLPPLYHVVAPGSAADRFSRPVAAVKPAPAPKQPTARWKAHAATDLTMVATVLKENDDAAGKTSASSSPSVVFQRNPRPALARTNSDTSAASAPPVSVPELPSSPAPTAPIVRPIAESHRLEAERRADRRRKRDDADDLATVDDDLQLALAISASMSSSSATTPLLELDWKTGTFKYPDPPALRGRAAKRQAPLRSLASTGILAVDEAKAEVQQAALTYLFDHAAPPSSSAGERNRTPSATRLASADPECRLWRAASPRPAEASWTSSSIPPACLSISSDEDEVDDEPPHPRSPDDDAMDVIMDDPPIPRHPPPLAPTDRIAARPPSVYEQETLRWQFVDESPLLSLFDSWTQSASCTTAADVVAKRRLLESQLQDLWASTVDWLNVRSATAPARVEPPTLSALPPSTAHRRPPAPALPSQPAPALSTPPPQPIPPRRAPVSKPAAPAASSSSRTILRPTAVARPPPADVPRAAEGDFPPYFDTRPPPSSAHPVAAGPPPRGGIDPGAPSAPDPAPPAPADSSTDLSRLKLAELK